MGKHGPCRHCGVTSTPLWRNGPPEKPVLCNACGSRWRTKGSLTNYTPLHSREALESEDYKISKVRTISFKPKELKAHKKRLSIDMNEIEQDIPCSGQNFRKIFEGDTSNRSSSGSAISYSESCAHFGVPDASDMTGSAQSNAWDPLVPSKKRSGVTRPKPSSVEKLTRDLHSIMHEQQSSYFSVSSEEDLLYESGTPMGVEIGHGGVLIRYIDSKTVDEESEASSLPIDNKSYITSEVYSGSASCLVHSESKEISDSNVGIEKLKKSAVAQEHVKRDKVSQGKIDILRDRDSPVSFIDLKDVKHEEIIEGKKIGTRSNFLEHSRLTSLKRHRDNQNQHNQESKGGAMRSPKRVMRPWKLNSIDASSKLVPDADDSVENEGACFSPRSIFASPPDRSSMLVSLQYTDESSDQDLLLDAPCNSSFPEAQLLFHPWNGTVQNSSLAESGVAEAGEESLSNHPSSSFSSQRHR